MFKLVVLSAILAVAAAKPSGGLIVSEPTLARVGGYVESLPSAVSHTSSTIVHARTPIVSPILTPAIRTHIAPVVKTFAAEPILRTIATPAFRTYAEPAIRTFAAEPLFRSTPLHYTATGPTFAYGGAPLLRSW